MKAVALVTTALVVALAASLLSEASGQVPGGIMDHRVESPRREERIFAFYTTTSIKRLATTTITAISTCLSITNTPAGCNGRKKRSFFRALENLEGLGLNGGESQLEGSQADEVEAGTGFEPRAVKDRVGRKLTVWSSNISTLTLTSTSYLAGTTITATAFCIAGSVTANTCFG